MGYAEREGAMMISISFYLDNIGNRRRVFAHPCYEIQGGQTDNQSGQTIKKIFGASRRIFLQKSLPTLAWNRAGAPVRSR